MIEPPPSGWDLAAAQPLADDDLVSTGADLEPGTLLQAYRSGLFPMGLGRHGGRPIGWWSPQRRGVLLRDDLRVSRSLRRSARTFRVSADSAFDEVVQACADPDRDGRWITGDIAAAYGRLHRLGWAHSIEVWADDGADGGDAGAGGRDQELVGGLYGVAVGGLFAGESMFHRRTDASKVALLALDRLWFADRDADRLIDVQWRTDHLGSLGVREIGRDEYFDRLRRALPLPVAQPFGD